MLLQAGFSSDGAPTINPVSLPPPPKFSYPGSVCFLLPLRALSDGLHRGTPGSKGSLGTDFKE